eukprot:scaffold88121_cov70-Cyclotella_meneghiniana.AAC.1
MMRYLRSANDPSIDDDSTISSIESTDITMWETLLHAMRYFVPTIHDGDDHRTGDAGTYTYRRIDSSNAKGRHMSSVKSLAVLIVLCLTLPLVGVALLSSHPVGSGESGQMTTAGKEGQVVVNEADDSKDSERSATDLIQDFLAAMSTDVCALDEEEPKMMCIVNNDDYSTDHSIRGMFTNFSSVMCALDEAPNHEQIQREDVGSSYLATSANHYAGFNDALDHRGNKMIDNRTASHPYVKLEVNPNYLQFVTNVKIRYKSTSPATHFPNYLHYSVLFNVLPKDTFQAYSERRELNVHCQSEALCNHYSNCSQHQLHVLDCHSETEFWIRFESLLKGLSDTDFASHKQYVRRTVRFLLIRDTEIVDWWDLTAKVPTDENWRSSMYEPRYVVDLRDTMDATLEPPMDQIPMRNQSQTKVEEIEFLSKSERYSVPHIGIRSESHSDSHDHSQNHIMSAWSKLLYGFLSTLPLGLGVLALIFGSDTLQLISSSNKEDEDTPSSPTMHNSTTNCPSDANKSPVMHENIKQITQCHQSSNLHRSKSEREGANDCSSLITSFPSLLTRQNQLTARKKMYSRQFGTDLQNSKTPLRSNLSSKESSRWLVGLNNSGIVPTGSLGDNMVPTKDKSSDSDSSNNFPSSHTMPSQVKVMDTTQNNVEASDVSETRENAPYSPPKVLRIDVLPFSNPPPFPASKATPVETTLTQQDHHASNSIKPEALSTVESQTVDDQTTSFEHQSETSCNVDIDPSQSPRKQVTKELSSNSPASSDATFTLHKNDDVFDDTKATIEATSVNEPDKSTNNHAKENAKCDAKVPTKEKVNAQSTRKYESQTKSRVPSPRKHPRHGFPVGHGNDANLPSHAPFVGLAEAIAANNLAGLSRLEYPRKKPRLPLTSERPFPRRSGAPGQSKKFAVSYPVDTSDELSFRSVDGTSDEYSVKSVDCDQEHIGQRVAKSFDGVTYFGTVTGYERGVNPELWRVSYDDASARREYYGRQELVEAMALYRTHGKHDNGSTTSSRSDRFIGDNIELAFSQQSSETQDNDDDKSDDTGTMEEKKARDKKRARTERRLLRTTKKPAVHKPSLAL